MEQLAGGVEAGIKASIHSMRVLWQEHSQECDWGFLLIDARNAFRKDNQKSTFWAVRHEWPSGTQFTFKCYWSTLLVRDTGDGSGHFLISKEGVTQGDTLSMITYGIGVPSPHKRASGSHPQVTQTWYADDAGSGAGGVGVFQQILYHLLEMQARVPPRVYFPEPTKSILVMVARNVARAEEFFRGMGF